MSSAAPEWQLPALDPYPERPDRKSGWLDGLEAAVNALPAVLKARIGDPYTPRLVAAVNALDGECRMLDDRALRDRADDLRRRLRRAGFAKPLIIEAFALVREAAGRTLGLRHHDVQLAGGLAMLNGMIAEMDTGEGKTLTATLTAATAALAGIPVHVVTANDYLAGRDARSMRPLYELLGLTVGAIDHSLDPAARAMAYLSDITYASNKEIAFDYLRDRIALGGRPLNLAIRLKRACGEVRSTGIVMRGLHFAIVDEADSVLVDEARTPLIISKETSAEQEHRWAETAMHIARQLESGRDYDVVAHERRVVLTRPGRARLTEIGDGLGGIWRSAVRLEEAARQALSAQHLFSRGEHYLVRDGKIEIIDEYTGRIMEGRSWSQGLHQLIELKEGCTVTARKVPMARMTYQRFFRRYRRLTGMTGTAREVRRELRAVYGLSVSRISTHAASQRRTLPARIFASAEEKWDAIAARAVELSAAGHPVLIGTRSVTASETLSSRLTEAGLPHEVLNASQDQREAEIIAAAGCSGRVTVATNMAGRGVDIPLDSAARGRDGLHVLLTERHDARRIDRQLEGRCGRQGEPGVAEAWLSLEDPLLELVPVRAVAAVRGLGPVIGHIVALALFRWAQRRAERAHSLLRRQLLKHDRELGTLLAFSGGQE